MLELNLIKINPTIFPDNTSQIWKLPDELLNKSYYNITWTYEHEGEFLQLAQLVDLLRYGNHASVVEEITLYLPYLPYGRQDKQITNNTTFALYSFAKQLNYLNFDKIFIMDPHSQMALNLILRSEARYPAWTLYKVYNITNTNLICYPDKGAIKKYMDIYDYNFIFANKERDQLTGEIVKYELVGGAHGKNVLIVDDICDGGRTFIELSRMLIESGAAQVNLFVTHGIFSKGLKYILDESPIDRVFTLKGEVFEDHDGNILYKEII